MRPKADAHETQRMYADYLKGMSCKDVGEKHFYSAKTVWRRFKDAGLKMRPSTRTISEYGAQS